MHPWREKKKSESDGDDEVFDHVAAHVARVEQRGIGPNRFPRHRRENINVQPKNRKQEQIEQTEAKRLAHFSGMGRQSQCSHERHGVKEEQKV